MKKLLLTLLICFGCDAGTTDKDTDTEPEVDTTTETEDVIPNCFEGDYIINNQDDVDAIQEYNCVTGDLEIDSTDLEVLSLPNLIEVHEHVKVLDNSNLTGIHLPKLTTIRSYLQVLRNEKLETLDGFSALTELGLWFFAYYNYSMPHCEICKFLTQLNEPPTSIDVLDNLPDECLLVPEDCK